MAAAQRLARGPGHLATGMAVRFRAPLWDVVGEHNAARSTERGAPARLTGVPYGADMRLFCTRGIPTVMVGTAGLELAHAVDERVQIDDLATVARIVVRAVGAAPLNGGH